MKITEETGRDGQRVLFITMNESETLSTIQSLANQLNKKDPNGCGLETFCDCGTYFSIAVTED